MGLMFAKLLNTIWMWQSRSAANEFRRATGALRATQERLLFETLRANADSVYGRKHSFERIRTLDEFQRRVPVCDYDALRPSIEAIARGAAGELTCEPVLMLEPTGGSTSGGKLVPYTATLRRQFQRAIGAWMYDVLSGLPAVRRGRAYWSISPAAQRPERTEGGPPIGFDDDTEYLPPWQRWAMSRLLAVPSAVGRIRDVDNFQYATLLGLLAAEDLALISVWSPTFLTSLLSRLGEWSERLSVDLRRGIVSWPTAVLTDGERVFERAARSWGDAKRAEQVACVLRRVSEKSGALDLTDCWPSLALVSAWGDATAADFVPALRRWFPNAAFQPKGVLATEGVISFPLLGQVGSALAVTSHVFEFQPLGSTAEERPAWAWKLERGASYRVLLTTGGGLYRYDLGDELEVVGFVNECPLVRLLGRGDVGCDLVGEKLHERHVRAAIAEGCERHGLRTEFALLAPRSDSPTPGYRAWLVCSPTHGAPEKNVAESIEDRLSTNTQYKYAMRLGQLSPLEVRLLNATPEQAWRWFVDECLRRGRKLGDIKPTTLVRDASFDAAFRAASSEETHCGDRVPPPPTPGRRLAD